MEIVLANGRMRKRYEKDREVRGEWYRKSLGRSERFNNITALLAVLTPTTLCNKLLLNNHKLQQTKVWVHS